MNHLLLHPAIPQIRRQASPGRHEILASVGVQFLLNYANRSIS